MMMVGDISGKGFKQITWNDNYKNLQDYVNKNFGINVQWVGGNNPCKLKENAEDAMISALAYWGKNNINSIAQQVSEECVKKVTEKINPYLEGLSERERYFKKAVEILKVNYCKLTINNTSPQLEEEPTVVVVSGSEIEFQNDPAIAGIKWAMYKVYVYNDMSLVTYKKLKKEKMLPKASYTSYLSRDTHQVTNSKKTKIFKHSNERYGQYNEVPPGDFFFSTWFKWSKIHHVCYR